MEIDVEHLMKLSKLKIDDGEKESFLLDFMRTIDLVSEISEMKLPDDLENGKSVSLSELREDEPEESLSREEVLANAPKQKDGCYVTPLVVE